MTFAELAISRATPKLKAPNFEKLLRFVNSVFDKQTSINDITQDMRNLGSDVSFVLDEIGKIFGVFPRPKIPATGFSGGDFFAYDLTAYDVAIYASEADAARTLNNSEYALFLRATAMITNMRGTVAEWELVYSILTGGAGVYIVNRTAEYDVIVFKELTTDEKRLVESLTRRTSNLTVKLNLLGTVPEGTSAFAYALSAYGSASYIITW